MNIINPYRFSGNDIPTDEVRYYKFNNSLSDDGTDGIDITDIGTSAITYSTGVVNESSVWGNNIKGSGTGLIFTDGSNNDLPFSFNFWVKSNGQSSTQFISSRRVGSLAGWALMFNSSSVVFNLYAATVSIYLSVTSTSLSVGTWYNISVKYDASGLASGLSIRVNNGTKTLGVNINSYDYNRQGGDLYWGVYGNSPQTAFELNGELDLFRVFDRTITDDEETALYNGGSGTE